MGFGFFVLLLRDNKITAVKHNNYLQLTSIVNTCVLVPRKGRMGISMPVMRLSVRY